MKTSSLKNILRASLFSLAATIFAVGYTGVANAQVASAAPMQQGVTSQRAEHVDITIFGERGAQVEESRTVTLSPGRNRIQLNGIASKYRNDSLRIISANGPGGFTYVSATYQPATLTKEKLLQAAVGSDVAVGSPTTGVAHGKLVSYSGNQLVVSTPDGETAILSDTLPIVLPTQQGLSNTSSLVVEADVAKAGEYTISFLYETEGLAWQAKHSAIYDDERGAFASFESTVSLVNQSGTNFQNATVWLLTGRANTREESAGMRSYALAAASADVRSASAENLGEQKVYRLPGEIDLADGQSRLVPLFSSKNVKVAREYFIPDMYYGYSGNGPVSVQTRLKVQNTDADHLGMPIPAGIVKVYQQNSAGRLQMVASAPVNHVSKNETFTMNIGTAGDIKAEAKMTVAKTLTMKVGKDDAEFQDQTFDVTLTNYKAKGDAKVRVELSVPNAQDDVAPLIRDAANRAHADVIVPGDGGKASVQYTLRVQRR